MLTLTDTQQLIRDTAWQFSKQELFGQSEGWEQQKIFPKEAYQRLAELGFCGILVPEKYHGVGADYLSLAFVIEAISYSSVALSTVFSVQNSVVCMPILKFGNDAQKEMFLKPLAQGEKLGCFALTEPEAGSDASSLRMSAVLVEDGYILNGTKQFITSGKNADVAIIFAKTNPSAGKKGITAFIVPTNTPGFSVSNIEKKMGQHASDTAALTLTDCKIPFSYRLGEEGEGYKIALSNLEGGRIGIAAQCVGAAQAAFDLTSSYVKERKSFGKALIEHQAIQFQLAEMKTELEAARLLTYHAAKLKDAGDDALMFAAMAKLYASEAAEKICSKAVNLHGGYGYLEDYRVEGIYRDIKVAQIYEGTSEVQKMIIGRYL